VLVDFGKLTLVPFKVELRVQLDNHHAYPVTVRHDTSTRKQTLNNLFDLVKRVNMLLLDISYFDTVRRPVSVFDEEQIPSTLTALTLYNPIFSGYLSLTSAPVTVDVENHVTPPIPITESLLQTG
jgi:hypothetical protein